MSSNVRVQALQNLGLRSFGRTRVAASAREVNYGPSRPRFGKLSLLSDKDFYPYLANSRSIEDERSFDASGKSNSMSVEVLCWVVSNNVDRILDPNELKE